MTKTILKTNLVLFVVLLSLLFQFNECNGQQQQQQQVKTSNQANKSNATTINVYASNATEALETSPSITSVHQVWTSSSSGSLNELSPEVISKLRNDVPFLAAYALRPRLVGGGSSPVGAQAAGGMELASKSLDAGAASSLQSARQTLLPRLGDFSELNVETSSLSKSEHHHKRKTSLRKRPGRADDEDRLGQLSRSSASQTIRPGAEVRSKRKRTARSSLSAKRHVSANKRSSSARSRVKSSKRTNRVAKSGRLLQSPKGKDAASDEATNSIEPDQAGGAGDVKGGKAANGTRRPFYANAGKPNKADEDKSLDDEAKQPTGTTENRNDNDLENDNRDVAAADDDDNSDAIDDEPKRVGDADVEEDGDTVLVEPKSDGVDDDPPVPTDGDEPDKPPTDQADGDSTDTEERPGASGEADERGRRVNRERPNQAPGAYPTVGGSAAGAGGIGATTGGGSSSSPADSDGGEDKQAEDDDNDDLDDNRSGSKDSGSNRPKGRSEVEFADGQDNDDKDQKRRKEADDDEPAGTGRTKTGGDAGDQENFGRRNKRPGSERDDNESPVRGVDKDGAAKDDSDEPDLDYRDQLDGDSKSRDSKVSGNRVDSDDEDAGNTMVGGPAKRPSEARKRNDTSGGSGECDDGSYKHHDEKYHDDHHQSIDWLRGSIPGEPGEDYPILSRVNSTTFNCHDQKYAGYYADVDTRCQVFHICQSDGRQDSFLCPNGTIFSQKTLVCVWWNGFDCEDAPKYYHLNALLYKRPADGVGMPETPQSAALPDQDDTLRPLDGAKASSPPKTPYLKPKGMSVAGADKSPGSSLNGGNSEADDASIDSLIRAMKRRPKEMAELSPEDEASIQRKSTSSLDEEPGTSSRLRARTIPRRKRRASTRHAPPKLKSRRVSRNSRRRKLRHGIKPRRRA